jgi:hypothetical protein
MWRSILPAMALAMLAQAQGPLRAGKYEIELRMPEGGLYPQAERQIEFRVSDTTREDALAGFAPVVRAVIDSRIIMPSMPGMAVIQEVAHAEGIPGDYGLHPVFPHGGTYELQLNIAPPGEQAFTVKLPLTVADEAPRGTKVEPAWKMDFASAPSKPAAGQEALLSFSFRSSKEPQKRQLEFEEVHERKFHLIVAKTDLSAMYHLHPEAQADGSFTLRFAFPEAGEYWLFADVAPRGRGSVVLRARLVVNGKDPRRFQLRKAPLNNKADVGGVQLTLNETAALERPGRTAKVGFAITTAQPLENYLGAAAHLLAISESGDLVHAHPLEELDAVRSTGQLQFTGRFAQAGRYRAWVEVLSGGSVRQLPFVLEAGNATAR